MVGVCSLESVQRKQGWTGGHILTNSSSGERMNAKTNDCAEPHVKGLKLDEMNRLVDEHVSMRHTDVLWLFVVNKHKLRTGSQLETLIQVARLLYH